METYKTLQIEIRLGPWQEWTGEVECDCIITDPPYSPKTHEGHNSLTKQIKKKKKIEYSAMRANDVWHFCNVWSPSVKGWMVIFTDHFSYPWYREALEANGRYVFAPIPFVDHGIRPRQCGDGPSNWTSWMVMARPKGREYTKSGSLPGYYGTDGKREKRFVIGGKPLTVMREIIKDYSKEDDLIVDPFCGGATTLIAAGIEGRRAIGFEKDPKTYSIAVDRLKEYNQRESYFEYQRRWKEASKEKNNGW